MAMDRKTTFCQSSSSGSKKTITLNDLKISKDSSIKLAFKLMHISSQTDCDIKGCQGSSHKKEVVNPTWFSATRLTNE
jgi:hypothetical protein